ncbi:GDP-mannose transporter [Dictyocoela roeselum]|nr:GDP-mannose transporter [Dictyocoela roeselum]
MDKNIEKLILIIVMFFSSFLATLINKTLMIQDDGSSPFFILAAQSAFVVFLLCGVKIVVFINKRVMCYKEVTVGKAKIWVEMYGYSTTKNKRTVNIENIDGNSNKNEFVKFNRNNHERLEENKFINLKTYITNELIHYTPKNNPRLFKSILLWNTTSLLLVLMVYSALESFKNLEISTFIMLKNFSIIITAILELYFFQRKIRLNSIAAFILIFIGSANVKPSRSNLGYIFILMNILSTSLFTISMRYTVLQEKTKDIDSLLISQTLTIPYLVILSYVFENDQTSSIRPDSLVISCVAVFLVAYSSIWCMRVLSSTTFCVIGSFNKILLSLSGVVFFNERLSAFKVFSIVCGSFSGVLYSKTILKE